MRTEQLTTTSEAVDEVWYTLNRFKPITYRAKAVHTMLFSMLSVLVPVSELFHLLCVVMIFISSLLRDGQNKHFHVRNS